MAGGLPLSGSGRVLALGTLPKLPALWCVGTQLTSHPRCEPGPRMSGDKTQS